MPRTAIRYARSQRRDELVSRLSENPDQLQEIVNEHRHRITISRDDV